jgi:hypothetical protein
VTAELDIFEALLRRSLERGVPSQAVADIFEMPLDVVKDMVREVKVEQFGTADKDEYTDNLQWLTLQRTEQVIRTGSPDQVARIATTVFGKQIQAAGKRPSSALEDQRKELMETFGHIREAPPALARAGRFVVGNTEVDRRANREGDDADED